MPSDETDLTAYVDAALAAMDLRIDPAWRDAVRANLAVTGQAAAELAAFELADDVLPAPGFDPEG